MEKGHQIVNILQRYSRVGFLCLIGESNIVRFLILIKHFFLFQKYFCFVSFVDFEYYS